MRLNTGERPTRGFPGTKAIWKEAGMGRDLGEYGFGLKGEADDTAGTLRGSNRGFRCLGVSEDRRAIEQKGPMDEGVFWQQIDEGKKWGFVQKGKE